MEFQVRHLQIETETRIQSAYCMYLASVRLLHGNGIFDNTIHNHAMELLRELENPRDGRSLIHAIVEGDRFVTELVQYTFDVDALRRARGGIQLLPCIPAPQQQ